MRLKFNFISSGMLFGETIIEKFASCVWEGTGKSKTRRAENPDVSYKVM